MVWGKNLDKKKKKKKIKLYNNIIYYIQHKILLT